jgi:uncharacterized protein YceH (UPF0502 family)
MSTDSQSTESPSSPRWQPLEAIERRVLGVLVEKAKTTPEAYPLSLNALRSGCNQKNNRSPLMQLEESQIEDALDALRKVGAASVVQGEGRIDRYRHRAYEWLDVDKVELAVMAELLLRGSQTVGELRGRAARMEPIKGLSELQPTLDSLEAKRLIQYLTPPGRGSVVTHTLYLDREMEKVRREAGEHVATAGTRQPVLTGAGSPSGGARSPVAAEPSRPASAPTPKRTTPPPIAKHADDTDQLRDQLDSLREELAAVKRELDTARNEFSTTADALRRDLDQLNRQLGN